MYYHSVIAIDIIFYDIPRKLVNSSNTTSVKLVQKYLFTYTYLFIDTGLSESYCYFSFGDF